MNWKLGNKTKQKTKKNTVTQVWIRKVASDVSIQQFQRCKKFASLNNLFVSLMDSYSTAIFGTSCKVILFREWWLKLLLNKSSSKNNAKEFEHFLRKVSSKLHDSVPANDHFAQVFLLEISTRLLFVPEIIFSKSFLYHRKTPWAICRKISCSALCFRNKKFQTCLWLKRCFRKARMEC